MLYIVYLVCMVLYLIRGIGWDRVLNFFDPITLEFLVFPCILILFATRSFKAFGRAFLYAFGRREYAPSRCRESLQAVRMVMETALVFGGICFLIGSINGIRSLEWSELDSIGWLFLDLSVAELSLFYALLICMILLPVYCLLKKEQCTRETAGRDSAEENLLNDDSQCR